MNRFRKFALEYAKFEVPKERFWKGIWMCAYGVKL